MKTAFAIFAAIVWLGVCSTIVAAGSIPLPAPEGDGPGTRKTTVQKPQKQVQTPPANQLAPTRDNVRPALKGTPPFKPLRSDDRKKIDDSMAPVN